MSETKVTYQCCQGWGCHEKCILKTFTKDGKIVRTQRSGDIGHIGNGPRICQKGISAWQIPYNDERLLHPLKRVGERGEGKFEQISWDQALDEISAGINASIEKYGPRSILGNIFYCGVPGNRNALGDTLVKRYFHAIGGSAIEGLGVDYAIVQQDSVDEGMPYVGGRFQVMNANNLIIIWGGNPIGFTRPARLTEMLLDARDRGAKIVHVSNLFDNTSAKVDEWVPVRSGTDAALALGMAHVIVREGKVNEEWLLKETAAALLVRTDTGKYLREADVIEGGAADKFGVFDKKTGQVGFIPRVTARAIDSTGRTTTGTVQMTYETETAEAGAGIYGAFDPAIDCETEVNGIPCKTSYKLLCEHLQKWTPEAAEAACGVPAARIEFLANLYVDSSPSLIAMGDGLRYGNGTQSLRAVKLLTYLTGNHGGPDGGTVITAGIDDIEGSIIDRNVAQWVPEISIENGDFAMVKDILASHDDSSMQQYKVFIVAEGNPLLNWPNKSFWRERMLPYFDMVVTFEIRMTDTCRWSDYVLPEATTFERYELIPDMDNNVILSEPAIEPLGDTRVSADIWREIAERTGVGQYFQMNQEEWCKFILENQPNPLVAPITADEDPQQAGEWAPLTYDRLKKKPVIHLTPNDHDDLPDPYGSAPAYFTETGLIQFYSEMHVEVGATMADLENTYVIDPELKKDYPLHLFIARHKYFMQGQFTNIPEMESLAFTQFGVALNPKTALERGLRDGDIVEVFNERGVMRSKLILREDVAPGVAHTWYSFNETYYPDTCTPQELATPNNAPETITPMSQVNGQRWFNMQLPVPPLGRFIAGNDAPEVIFDVVCDVRKAE